MYKVSDLSTGDVLISADGRYRLTTIIVAAFTEANLSNGGGSSGNARMNQTNRYYTLDKLDQKQTARMIRL